MGVLFVLTLWRFFQRKNYEHKIELEIIAKTARNLFVSAFLSNFAFVLRKFRNFA